MDILSNYNFTQCELQNAVLHNVPAQPAELVEGQFYYNTATKRGYMWNGTIGKPMDADDAEMSGDDIITALNASTMLIDDNNLSTAMNTAKNSAHSHTNSSTLAAITAAYTTEEKAKLSNILANADVTNATNVAAAIVSASAKTTPVDADTIPLIDSAASNALKEVTWAQVKATLKTYTDTLYNKYVHPNHSGDVTSTSDGATVIGTSKVVNSMLATVATATIKGRATASTGVVEDLTATQVRTILNVADGANNYQHPASHAISEVTGLQGALDGKVDDSQVQTNVPTGAIFTDTTTTINGKTGIILKADVVALGIPAQDTVYTHPATDGSRHVPATGTTNNGKVLTAGSTAASEVWATPSVAWANITSKPISTVANIDAAVTASHGHTNKALLDAYTQTETDLNDAVDKKHAQNTDTGTSSATFTIGSSGVKVKNSSGTELQVRNNADTGFADLRVNKLYIMGDTTEIVSNIVTIGDSDIELNSDITTSAMNSDGGITIKRLKADNVTRADAKLTFNNSSGKFQVTQGAVASPLVTASLPVKLVAVLGDGTATSFIITHDLNTFDIVDSLRYTAAPYSKVLTNVDYTSLDTVTVSFKRAPALNQFTLTLIG